VDKETQAVDVLDRLNLNHEAPVLSGPGMAIIYHAMEVQVNLELEGYIEKSGKYVLSRKFASCSFSGEFATLMNQLASPIARIEAMVVGDYGISATAIILALIS